ncbi:MAG: glycosyltransferase family 4 protein [Planctomycetes bacterium]|nr:glycosyltransferase family 4 protein [Planctomycetota bacterium]
MSRPRIVVLYHYQRPDDVVSARLYDDLCAGLAARGWDVEARPSNRACHDRTAAFAPRERWNGVAFRRVWRPPLSQSTARGRLLNAAWLTSAWLADLATRRRPPDVVLVGTDPVLAVSLAAPLRRLRPGVRIAHWVFDVYPEAAIADGLLPADGVLAASLRRLAARSYHACDLIADVGPVMRERLARYPSPARRVTLPPWGLVESGEVSAADEAARAALFGPDAGLGLLYSGSFGRAHDSDLFAALARRLAGTRVRLCLAGRGHRVDALLAHAGGMIRVADFCPEEHLARRLAAADVHLVSLRSEWTGLVVPSKFFGALAAGRPVVYAGPAASDIGRWIEALGVGWVLDGTSLNRVAAALIRLSEDRAALNQLKRRCHAAYLEHFARERTLSRWHEALLGLVRARPLARDRAE